MLSKFNSANAVQTTAIAIAVVLGITTLAHADEYERWVAIDNYGANEIVDIRMSPIGDEFWGPNLLARDYIAVGEGITVEPLDGVGYCLFDVLIGFADGSEIPLWEVDLCAARSVAVDEWEYEVSYL